MAAFRNGRWLLRLPLGDRVTLVALSAATAQERQGALTATAAGWCLRPVQADVSEGGRSVLVDVCRSLGLDFGHITGGATARFAELVIQAVEAGRILVLHEPPRAISVIPDFKPADLIPPPAKKPEEEKKAWLEIFVTVGGQKPYVGLVEIELPDGKKLQQKTDNDGFIYLKEVPTGDCRVRLPEADR